VTATLEKLEECLKCYPNFSMPVAIVKTLTDVMKSSQASTVSELVEALETIANELKLQHPCKVSVAAGCEVFFRIVLRISLDADFETWRTHSIKRGELLMERCEPIRCRIGQLGCRLFRNHTTILIHSYSRTLLQLLTTAATEPIRFKVIVTEGMPNHQGQKMAKALCERHIPVSLISDSAVAHSIQQVDMVWVGAEGVVESGGIINQIGTYQLAIVAKMANKPFYVAVESFKFVRMFPLNQCDFPNRWMSPSSSSSDQEDMIHKELPLLDYTPPEYIHMLVTDLGILTPSAVSDELIKLYL
jgi:translation initiation factor eIF-2B subunit alpha